MQRLNRAIVVTLREEAAVGLSVLCKVHADLPRRADKSKGVDGLPVRRQRVSVRSAVVQAERVPLTPDRNDKFIRS